MRISLANRIRGAGPVWWTRKVRPLKVSVVDSCQTLCRAPLAERRGICGGLQRLAFVEAEAVILSPVDGMSIRWRGYHNQHGRDTCASAHTLFPQLPSASREVSRIDMCDIFLPSRVVTPHKISLWMLWMATAGRHP